MMIGGQQQQQQQHLVGATSSLATKHPSLQVQLEHVSLNRIMCGQWREGMNVRAMDAVLEIVLSDAQDNTINTAAAVGISTPRNIVYNLITTL